MAIKVDTDILESKASYASSLASQLIGKSSEINNIYFGLDSKIKNRESIGSSLLSLQSRMDKVQHKMYNISSFLTNTASRYRSSEARIATNLESIRFSTSVSKNANGAGQGKIFDRDDDKKWYQTNLFKLAVGAVVVGAAVASAIVVGGPVLVAMAVGAVIGAGVGGVIGGISSMHNGGEFIDGFSDGFMWGAISGVVSGAAGAAGMGIGAFAVDGLIDSSVYIGQTMQNGGDVTLTGVLTSFVVGGGFSAVGSVVSNKISGLMSKKVNAVAVKPEIKLATDAVDGGSKLLSSAEAEEYAFNAIKGSDKADSVMLGKYEKGSLSSYDEMAGVYDSQYFNLDNWDELSSNYSRDEIWKINEKFLDIQTSSGRESYLSHNPAEYLEDGSYYSSEIQYLIDNGYKFAKEGDVWHAIR